MTGRTVVRVVTGAAAAVLAPMLGACGGSGSGSGSGERAAPSGTATVPAAAVRHAMPRRRPTRAAVETCSTRSHAGFPAFSNPNNLVVGPLALVGAAYTPPETVRQFGGNKFPALVRAGHRVTVALPRRLHRVVSLGYGPLPQGVELRPRDGHRAVTFVACRRGRPSGSAAGGEPVTFWSGFVLTASPRCVPLAVWVDEEPAPRRVWLRMGVRRCP